jgi:hypothetical protein
MVGEEYIHVKRSIAEITRKAAMDEYGCRRHQLGAGGDRLPERVATSPERPKDFWERVKPSPLMAMLTINMCTAADNAWSRGRLIDAEVKYTKAIRYLEPILRQYVDDTEMREWTERQLQILKLKLRGCQLDPSLAVTAALPPLYSRACTARADGYV